MTERIRKVNSSIMHELSRAIATKINFKPGVFVTISKVDTTTDLRYTRVFVRVYPQSEIQYAMKTLEHEQRGLQKDLHSKLPIKILPKLTFVHDPRGDEVEEIERLLEQ